MSQSFSRIDLVNASRAKFSFKTDKFRLLADGDLHVRLGKDGDHISGHQRKVLGGISFDGLPQIERQQMKSEIRGIQALNDGVSAVNFRRRTLDLVLECFLFYSS